MHQDFAQVGRDAMELMLAVLNDYDTPTRCSGCRSWSSAEAWRHRSGADPSLLIIRWAMTARRADSRIIPSLKRVNEDRFSAKHPVCVPSGFAPTPP